MKRNSLQTLEKMSSLLLSILLVLAMTFSLASCSIGDVLASSESEQSEYTESIGTNTQTTGGEKESTEPVSENSTTEPLGDSTDPENENTEPETKNETGESVDNKENSEPSGNEEANSDKNASETVVYNEVVIQGSSDNVVYAAAKGLRSAVSVYCTFQTTTTSGYSRWNPTPTTKTYYSTGSGVFYSIQEDGSAFIITNFHVVYDASSNTENHVSDQIYVYLYGMESEEYAIPVTYVGGSANYDLAVLYVDKNEIVAASYGAGSLAPVTVGDSDALVPGDTAIAVGNPSATDLSGISVTKGIISVDSEYITMTASDNSGEKSFRVIRIDTPINSGNSGGGLYNGKGELIGIVNAKISSSEIESIGYALPSSVVRAVADNIIDYCFEKECESVMRGILGITVSVTGKSTVYDIETGKLYRLETVSVYEVTKGGIGEAILMAGDIVKSITLGGKTVSVTRQHHLIDAMIDVRVGDTVKLEIERNGETMTVETIITEECITAY